MSKIVISLAAGRAPRLVAFLRRAVIAAAFAGLASMAHPATAQVPQTPDRRTPAARIDDALRNITALARPGQVGYATIWDGNKYVQCRRLPDHSLRCEAAGTAMQPTLGKVMTGDRLNRLTELGWTLDGKFGNYVHRFAAGMPTAIIADHIQRTLAEAYDAKVADLEIETAWVADTPCPPRNGPSQNLAGIVNDATAMLPTAVIACSYTAPASRVQPIQSAAALIARDGATVAAEIQRLRINATRNVFTVFDPGIGYIQCAPETPTPTIYCEAQSAESWAALAAILTPERIALLHQAGYADPGRAPNYWKSYPAEKFDDKAIAGEILRLLHDVYGYNGVAELVIKAK